jgi:hypothetical protein
MAAVGDREDIPLSSPGAGPSRISLDAHNGEGDSAENKLGQSGVTSYQERREEAEQREMCA